MKQIVIKLSDALPSKEGFYLMQAKPGCSRVESVFVRGDGMGGLMVNTYRGTDPIEHKKFKGLKWSKEILLGGLA
jgi:hypothetical protein